MRNIGRITMAVVALIIGILSVAAVYSIAQGKPSNRNSAMASGKNPMVGMVFCNKMSTGELCPGGTANTLKLSGEVATRWRADVHQYNKAVEAANRRLLAEANRTLSPQQYSEVTRWFAKGLNPLMNQLLVAQGRLAQ
ncbi:MAG: hypothetical protein KGM47_18925 [Acidobacteriota bacterium]|nr:hypothetical protein [Acidobacteriota bacterium]